MSYSLWKKSREQHWTDNEIIEWVMRLMIEDFLTTKAFLTSPSSADKENKKLYTKNKGTYLTISNI